MGVRFQGGVIGERAVAAKADAISLGRAQRTQFLARIGRVRVMASRTRESVRASADQKITGLTGADVTASRIRASSSSFPGERIARKEYLVAAGAGAVDRS
jgi:hypothetical protein